jgi:hypothetical protein
MTNVAHGLCTAVHVWKDTINESAKLIGHAIKSFFLVRSFDELGMLHGASSNGGDDGHSCMRVEVSQQSSGYTAVARVCTLLMRCGMTTGTANEIDRVPVYEHGCVACVGTDGECTVVASKLLSHNLLGKEFCWVCIVQPCPMVLPGYWWLSGVDCWG